MRKFKKKKYIIILIWLKVEKAIIFLKSSSTFAIKPPSRKLKILKYRKILENFNKEIGKLRLESKYSPAVTKVEEWTIAEIGVGADIAAGSQVESGN